jgi:hypothetical protein
MKHQTLEINDLPKAYQRLYREFSKTLDENDPSKARKLFGPLIDYYIENNYEVPEEIEINYARLYILELQDETGKN